MKMGKYWECRPQLSCGIACYSSMVCALCRDQTCLPSSMWGPAASTVSTQLGSLKFTKPKPRDLPVVGFMTTTQSSTSPNRLKYCSSDAYNKQTASHSMTNPLQLKDKQALWPIGGGTYWARRATAHPLFGSCGPPLSLARSLFWVM